MGVTLGGWSPDQFADDPRPFTREELDKVAPNVPVPAIHARADVPQQPRHRSDGLDKMTEPWVVRDASGRPTGVTTAMPAAPTASRDSSAELPKDIFEKSSLAMLRELNSAG